jgi:hypothetical protein
MLRYELKHDTDYITANAIMVIKASKIDSYLFLNDTFLSSILLITQCHEIMSHYHQVDGHVLILTHFHPNFRTFKFIFSKLILGLFCIGVLLQMLQRGTTSIVIFPNI